MGDATGTTTPSPILSAIEGQFVPKPLNLVSYCFIGKEQSLLKITINNGGLLDIQTSRVLIPCSCEARVVNNVVIIAHPHAGDVPVTGNMFQEWIEDGSIEIDEA